MNRTKLEPVYHFTNSLSHQFGIQLIQAFMMDEMSDMVTAPRASALIGGTFAAPLLAPIDIARFTHLMMVGTHVIAWLAVFHVVEQELHRSAGGLEIPTTED